ncbi:hypothetical protein OROGR_009656 [Orobanche gracilis]
MGDNNFNLPPGFRFYPTDEELVVHFLHRKASLLPCHPDVIPDLDLHPYDPWDLDGKAMVEENKWYFYSRRTQSRISGSGYWQSVGIEDPIHSSSSGQRVGMKKYNVFFLGEPSQGLKTNWIMQEYRLSDSTSSSSSSSSSSSRRRRSSKNVDFSRWVICCVYERNSDNDGDDGVELSCLDEVFLSLDDLDEISLPNSN